MKSCSTPGAWTRRRVPPPEPPRRAHVQHAVADEPGAYGTVARQPLGGIAGRAGHRPAVGGRTGAGPERGRRASGPGRAARHHRRQRRPLPEPGAVHRSHRLRRRAGLPAGQPGGRTWPVDLRRDDRAGADRQPGRHLQ
ncbi:hypothetical protein G6F31_016609 [Rhizopus arrhizus]|nr:hypothetical protein G6F31_016609 [Rhizopus arrhizus]